MTTKAAGNGNGSETLLLTPREAAEGGSMIQCGCTSLPARGRVARL